MRAAILLILSTLLLCATAAGAGTERGLSSRLMAGTGFGYGTGDNARGGGIALLTDADLAWSFSRSRSILLTAEAAGLFPISNLENLYERHLHSLDHIAFMLGLEQSAPEPGLHPFLQAGVGIGRIEANEARATGVAVGGAAGLRVLSPHGEIGITLGLRTGHVIASDARSSATAIAFGLHLHPRVVRGTSETPR